jgi:hypothetical protein
VGLDAATDRSGAERIPNMPSVADYWPDDARLEPRSVAEPPQPPGDDHPRGVRPMTGGLVVLALFVVVGVVLAMFVKQANSHPDTSAAAPATTPGVAVASPAPTGTVPIAPKPTASAPSAQSPPSLPALPPADAPKPLPTATFEVAASAGSVTVRSQELGSDLYRVTLAKSDARVTAKISDKGTNHRLTLVKTAETDVPPVIITLDAGLRWNLKLSAGNTETAVNLTQSKLASVELAGGAHLFALSLPRATGTLPLRVTHGMNQLKINTDGAPVRTTLRVGAGKVVLDGVTHTDTKPGKVLTSAGWSKATDRVDIDAVEGLGTLTVDTD